MVKVGDKVTFHMIPMHLCGGGGGKLSPEVIERRKALGLSEEPPKQCECNVEAMVSYPAEVITVHEPDPNDGPAVPQALEIEVAMPEDVTALGYATRQSSSAEATTTPPESGTWTSTPTS